MLKTINCARYFFYGYWQGKAFSPLRASNLQAYQARRYHQLIKYLTKHSPFYRAYRNAKFSDLPIIDKSQFIKHFDHINTVNLSLEQCLQHGLEAEKQRNFSPKIKGITVGLSSGTSGQRGVFLVSDTEQAQWAGYILAKNIVFSLKQQRVALFLRSNSNLYESSHGRLIKFRFFDLTRAFPTLLAELEVYQPHILIAPAHVLSLIAQEKTQIQPRKIISVAEVLEDPAKQAIETYFHLRVEQIYQATEGYIASTCHRGHLHINEDILQVEKQWLDPSSGRFTPIITDFNRRTLPIIRYRLDDILIEDKHPCPCGSPFTRLKKIEGRADDILWFKNTHSGKSQALFPDILRRALFVCRSQVEDYRIEQHGHRLLLSLQSQHPQRAIQDIHRELQALFASLELEPPQLEFQLGVSQDNSKKLRRICCRKKPHDGEGRKREQSGET